MVLTWCEGTEWIPYMVKSIRLSKTTSTLLFWRIWKTRFSKLFGLNFDLAVSQGDIAVLCWEIFKPSADDSAVLRYLSKCLSSIESHYTNCGLLIVGDFNRLNTTRLQNSYDLKQIGNRTLHLILQI